ncbi:MAG TPA: HAD hydrolase family protein [Longimicrobiales bacterium]|nr:HAD hydrolase family protein [Longimicrobiales bacterium]
MAEGIPRELAGRIRVVVLDVDGVLTDNGVYLGRAAGGEAVELKRFHIMDGLGIKMLEWAGLRVVLVSGRASGATEIRARELGVECLQEGSRKAPVVARVLAREGADWGELAMVADDLADLPVMRRAGLPVAVANAAPEIRAQARWVTRRAGGEGAVRDFAEALLHARGQWERLVEAYCRSREEGGDVPEHLEGL